MEVVFCMGSGYHHSLLNIEEIIFANRFLLPPPDFRKRNLGAISAYKLASLVAAKFHIALQVLCTKIGVPNLTLVR
jgi:hypothetical protein